MYTETSCFHRITHRGTNESIARKLKQGYLEANYPKPNITIVKYAEHTKRQFGYQKVILHC